MLPEHMRSPDPTVGGNSITETGALCISSGSKAGRVPKQKRIVEDDITRDVSSLTCLKKNLKIFLPSSDLSNKFEICRDTKEMREIIKREENDILVCFFNKLLANVARCAFVLSFRRSIGVLLTFPAPPKATLPTSREQLTS